MSLGQHVYSLVNVPMTLAVHHFYLAIYGTILSFGTQYYDLSARASKAAAITTQAHRFCQL